MVVVRLLKPIFRFCAKAKNLFKTLGVQAKVVELDQMGSSGSQIQGTLTKMYGQRTVPYVFINGELLGGADATLRAHDDGTLLKRLNAAGVQVTAGREEL